MTRFLLLAGIACICLACITTPQNPSVPTPLTIVSPVNSSVTPTAETPTPGSVTVFLYFTVSDPTTMDLQPVSRQIPASGTLEEMLTATLLALLQGPTATESNQGLISWFSGSTADTLLFVSVSVTGEVRVDFTQLPALIPNASASAGSHMLISQLNQTIFQFPDVSRIWYNLDGSCQAFWEWLQYGCHSVERADWEQEQAS